MKRNWKTYHAFDGFKPTPNHCYDTNKMHHANYKLAKNIYEWGKR